MMRKESLFEPICMYLKTHPDTGQGFCEREDEGHVFKAYTDFLVQYLLFYPIDLLHAENQSVYKARWTSFH